MKYYLLSTVILSVFLTGCATTQSSRYDNRLAGRIARIEEKTDEQNQEIMALKYEIEDISKQLANLKHQGRSHTPIQPQKSVKEKHNRIIRVSVSPQRVQKALKNAGYYDGAIDGKIGKNSQKAIQEFQKDHDLKIDGLVGKKTWFEMKKYLN